MKHKPDIQKQESHEKYNETPRVPHTSKKTTTKHNATQDREKVITTQ